MPSYIAEGKHAVAVYFEVAEDPLGDHDGAAHLNQSIPLAPRDTTHAAIGWRIYEYSLASGHWISHRQAHTEPPCWRDSEAPDTLMCPREEYVEVADGNPYAETTLGSTRAPTTTGTLSDFYDRSLRRRRRRRRRATTAASTASAFSRRT